MAAIEVITEARRAMEDQVLDLVTLVKCMDSIAPDQTPVWLAVFFGRIIDLDTKVNAYMDAVHEHAMPVLRDMAVISGAGKKVSSAAENG